MTQSAADDDDRLRREGRRIAEGLRDQRFGRPSRWRQALHAAAWISDHDPAILNVGDELFRCGDELCCDHLISAYAVGAQARHRDSGATSLLAGMLTQVLEHPQRTDPDALR